MVCVRKIEFKIGFTYIYVFLHICVLLTVAESICIASIYLRQYSHLRMPLYLLICAMCHCIVWGLKFSVQGVRFRAQGSGLQFGVWGLLSLLPVRGLEFRVWGLWFRGFGV